MHGASVVHFKGVRGGSVVFWAIVWPIVPSQSPLDWCVGLHFRGGWFFVAGVFVFGVLWAALRVDTAGLVVVGFS